MILQESLWPGMTRQGFAHRTRVHVTGSDREAFPVTAEGQWLPTVNVSTVSLEKARTAVRRLELEVPEFRQSLASMALRTAESVDSTGCWVADMEGDHTDTLWQIAELDMGGPILDTKLAKAALRVCDLEECINARHYDFTHQVKNRTDLLAVDERFFETQSDGSILPVWEASQVSPFTLPSVEDSAKALRHLQQRCTPFVNNPLEAPLTAGSVSKITLDETTGCWVTRTYYTRPSDFVGGFMFDGYGRLGFGPSLQASGAGKPGRYVAHRVTWVATGNELEPGKILNHECGFHPCCNPAHITQTTSRENNFHSLRMHAAIRSLA